VVGLRPVRRDDLVRRFKRLGFDGPFSGGRHQFMVRGHVTVRVPNPHASDIGVGLLSRILRQAGIDRDQWDRAAGRDTGGAGDVREPRVRYRKTAAKRRARS